MHYKLDKQELGRNLQGAKASPWHPLLVLFGSISDYYILYWMNIGSNAEL